MTAKFIRINNVQLEYRITDDREPRFEVFAPDGYVFEPDGVSSFVCIDMEDAIERVTASTLEFEP